MLRSSPGTISSTVIKADRGGMAAGRDIIGIMPADLTAIVKAATDPLVQQLNAAQQGTIADLGRQLGTRNEQILSFFRIIGETGVATDAIPDRLIEIAERFKELRDQD